MTNDLVSIIIPAYNVAPYLDRCVQSACAQTYRNIEIILVDDGSTDESGEMCDRWAEKDSSVRVVHKMNGGLSDARNSGLDIANGEYILFVDGDDYVDANLVSTVLNSMSESVDMVVFGYTEVYDNHATQRIVFPRSKYSISSNRDKLNCIVGPFFKYALGWQATNRLFLKSIIDKYNIRFVNNSKVFAEDQCFCLMYLAHCNQIVVIEDCLYNYYQRSGSIMNTDRRNETPRFGKKNELAIEILNHYSQFDDCVMLLDFFPIIHYFVLERPIVIFESIYRKKLNRLRALIIEDISSISDIDLFYQDLKMMLLPDNKKIISTNYGFLHMLEKTGRAKWLLTGRSFWYTILVKFRKRLMKR